jgi:hypothetical protein
MRKNSEEQRTGRVQSSSDEILGQSKNSIRVTNRPKPSTADIAEELGFKQSRLPDIGPGSLKPSYGRGGSPVPDNYYLGESDLKVKEKKGEGIAESKKSPKTDTNKPKWSDLT